MASWKFWKRILTDILGVLLLVSSLLLGWLPGPGGIPLMLAGLSLLAINHTWARRWLEKVKGEGSKIFSKIFSDNPILMWVVDGLSLVALLLSWAVLSFFSGRIADNTAFVLVFLALTLFLSNRRRLHWIMARIRKQ